MKTLLVSGGDTPPPRPLVELIARGSTAFEERTAADLSGGRSLPDADRLVFWSDGLDASVSDLAARYHRAEERQGREMIVFVTSSPSESVTALPNTETYVWPQDRERLEMAFLTGA
jgi:hypothetical protein